MYEPLKKLTLGLLKVPPKPDPPAGDPEQLQVFLAADAYYRYRLAVWAIRAIFVCGFLGLPGAGGAIGAVVAIGEGEVLAGALIALVALAFLTFLPVWLVLSWAALRLDYEMRWYMVTDRSLRIREGVYHVREMTLTFANIQNVSVSQGPIQRYFGIQDLLVQTAGGGGMQPGAQGAHGGGGMHLGFIRGVDNAEEIRAVMLERLKRTKDAGLGDTDDKRLKSRGKGAPSAAALAAARELVAEAKALRAAAAA